MIAIFVPRFYVRARYGADDVVDLSEPSSVQSFGIRIMIIKEKNIALLQ